jgi:hypothetical protein
MKRLLLIILICLLPMGAWSTDYYGGAAGKNLNANDLWFIQSEITGSCAATGTPVASSTVLQAGNTLYANGCTIAITDSFTATKISTEDGDGAGAAVGGGGFTIATDTVTGKTITANIAGGTSTALTMSGAGTLTITGNITASSTTLSSHGLVCSGNAYTLTVNGNVTGGGGTTNSIGISTTGYGASTVNGNVTAGSSQNYSAPGIYHNNYEGYEVTITGNIINTRQNSACYGACLWAPSSAQKYVRYVTTGGSNTLSSGAGIGSDASGTQVTGANTAAQVAEDSYFIKKDDGVYTEGTKAAGGGGGAWGF